MKKLGSVSNNSSRRAKVLVVCPIRNERVRVQRMLDSVIRQTESNWRLLFVDNCSDDGTSEFLLENAAKESRIDVYQQPSPVSVHENFSSAFSLALKLYDAEFVQLLAGDDELAGASYLRLGLDGLAAETADVALGLIDHFADNKIEENVFESHKPKSSLTILPRMAIDYWRCNAIYGLYRIQAFRKIFESPKYTFTPNLSSDWWFSYGVHLSLGIVGVPGMVYRKFRKGLVYRDSHYSPTVKKQAVGSIRLALFAPFARLGDRYKLLPVWEAAYALLLFMVVDSSRTVRKLFESSR